MTRRAKGYSTFKMKGSPMYRNYGIGSPMRNEDPPAAATDSVVVKPSDIPYVREAGTERPMIESMGQGVSEAAKRGRLHEISGEGGGTYTTPALENLWNHIQGMEKGKKRDSAIAHYNKKREEMHARMKAEIEAGNE